MILKRIFGLSSSGDKSPPSRTEAIEEAEGHKRAGARYVGDFVFGALDGSITTFAIVAGAAGAALAASVVLILGLANLFGDGASMALGNYLATKSEKEYRDQLRRREEWEVERLPEREREEIREIYHNKGLRGKDLERIVDVITSDKKTWVDTMMREELDLSIKGKTSHISGLTTFVAFVLVGFVPLIAYIFALFSPGFSANAFPISVALTFAAIFAVGSARSYVTGKRWWAAGFEMTVVCAAAASIAYGVGGLIGSLLM